MNREEMGVFPQALTNVASEYWEEEDRREIKVGRRVEATGSRVQGDLRTWVVHGYRKPQYPDFRVNNTAKRIQTSACPIEVAGWAGAWGKRDPGTWWRKKTLVQG